MNIYERTYSFVLANPGTQRSKLSEILGLSEYRINRILRIIERDLDGHAVVNCSERGVWVIKIDPHKCLGVSWRGRGIGFRQCENDPEFRDCRCYEHSEYENAELMALMRRLHYLVGPMEPSAFHISTLDTDIVEDLLRAANTIVPFTKKDALMKAAYISMIRSALAMIRWKEAMRARQRENWIPHDFWEKHKKSSVNPFEFVVRKYFVILEIPADSNREEVIKAWRRLARKYHPDHHGGYEDKMKEINEAKDRIFRIRRWS